MGRAATTIPRRETVIELALKGILPRDIAARTGLSLNTVYSDLREARRKGQNIPRFVGGLRTGESRAQFVSFQLRLEDTRTLEAHAGARGMSVQTLAKRLLERIERDDLVTAVLDDGGGDV